EVQVWLEFRRVLFRSGAAVTVLRHGVATPHLDDGWDLIVLSPGPGRPAAFGVPDLVKACIARGLPLFGVCLGLQGIVEALGGSRSEERRAGTGGRPRR